MEKFGMTVHRYAERGVRLTHGDGSVLTGVQFYEYPVDVPPLIHVESIDLTLYRDVWTRKGWAVVGSVA